MQRNFLLYSDPGPDLCMAKTLAVMGVLVFKVGDVGIGLGSFSSLQ